MWNNPTLWKIARQTPVSSTAPSAPLGLGAARRLVCRGIFAAASLAASGATGAQEAGYFYGLRLTAPLSIKDDGAARVGAWSFAAPGLKLGQSLEFSPPESVALSQATATAFRGYRFSSGLSLAAAFTTVGMPSYSPLSSVEAPVGAIGIRFDGARWIDARNRSINLDVVSAFSYGRALSVYGKLGVARGEARLSDALGVVAVERTAMAYGVGVRYDFSSSLGLKLELSRGTRLGFDRLRTDSDPDSINLGLRWSF